VAVSGITRAWCRAGTRPVDMPHRWCDDLCYNDPFVFELVSKAGAVVTLKLANDVALDQEKPP
jgi:hypothetical protein